MGKQKNYELYQHTRFSTLKELLYLCAEEHKANTAFKLKKGKATVSISFQQFKSEVDALGTYLYEQTFHNCSIAIYGENSYEWILAHFAITCGKNVAVPIDKELDVSGIAELLIDSESRVLIYSDTYQDIVEQLQEKGSNTVCVNMKDIPLFIEKVPDK